MSTRKPSSGTAEAAGTKSAAQWKQEFLDQAEQARANKFEAGLDTDLLIQGGRGVRQLVAGNAELAQALAREDADGAFFDALLSLCDDLSALRGLAPPKLNAWPVMSPDDRATVDRIVTWLKGRIERVRLAGEALRSRDDAARFGVPSKVGESPNSALDAIRTFRVAAKAAPKLLERARIKPSELAELDAFQKELELVLHQKSGNLSEHAELKEKIRLHALAIEDQLKETRLRALAALEKQPALLNLLLGQLPRAPERRRKPKAESDGAGENEKDPAGKDQGGSGGDKGSGSGGSDGGGAPKA